MSDTMIPTMSLRFVTRRVPAPFDSSKDSFGSATVRMIDARVLQQLFRSTGGLDHWIDVPLVNGKGSSEDSAT